MTSTAGEGQSSQIAAILDKTKENLTDSITKVEPRLLWAGTVFMCSRSGR